MSAGNPDRKVHVYAVFSSLNCESDLNIHKARQLRTRMDHFGPFLARRSPFLSLHTLQELVGEQ